MDGLEDVLRASFEFPTVIFTVLALISILLLVLSMLGLDIDGLDGADAGVDALDGAADGLFDSLGIADVPITIVATILSVVAWFVSVLAQMFLLDDVSGWALAGWAVVLGIGAALVALGATMLIAPWLSRAFETKSAISKRDLVGRVAEVRSQTVSDSFGYADVRGDHGGVLRVEIRTSPLSPDRLTDATSGSNVLLVSFDEAHDVFIVGAFPFELDA